MDRKQIEGQIGELQNENIELNNMLDDPVYASANREILSDNLVAIKLLQFVVDNATDEDIRLAQITLPGRASLMRWAKKHMEE